MLLLMLLFQLPSGHPILIADQTAALAQGTRNALNTKLLPPHVLQSSSIHVTCTISPV